MSITDEDIIPLPDVPALFPKARLKLATLRAEASRGRLKTFKLGRRIYTTPRDLRDMPAACCDADSSPRIYREISGGRVRRGMTLAEINRMIRAAIRAARQEGAPVVEVKIGDDATVRIPLVPDKPIAEPDEVVL